MKAEVPYLARLAQQAAGQAMLRPPRQLFAGGADMPAHLPDSGGSPRRRAVSAATRLPGPLAPAATGEERIAPGAAAAERGADTGEERAAGLEPGSATIAAPVLTPDAAAMPVTSTAPGTAAMPVTSTAPDAAAMPVASTAPGTAAMPDTTAEQPPATSAGQEPAAGIRVSPDGPDRHQPPQVVPRRRSASRPGLPAAGPANSVSARPTAPPEGPPVPDTSRPMADAGRARPPGAWASPLWGAPVDLPEAAELAPTAGGAARRAVSVSPAGSATAPSEPGTAAAAGSPQGQRTDDTGHLVAREAAGHQMPGAEAAAGQDRRREPAPVLDLTPTSTSRTPPAQEFGAERGEPYREPGAPERARVSIGTIEVTVVPPAPPVPAAREAQPPALVTSGWVRPPSLLASSVGRDRLRDGFRRWYGTAQG